MSEDRPCVGVIDTGSNSIKALVAARTSSGAVVAVEQRTLDVRISAGISGNPPRLSDAGIAAGITAIAELADLLRSHSPQAITIVATSAVRDAVNGAEFSRQVESQTGIPLRILTGDEEARLIGRGLRCDPALADWTDFHVFDLGGGSLECLHFADGAIVDGFSLPLGCVRLSEKFVTDPAAPFSPAERAAVHRHVRDALAASPLDFSGATRPAVFSGGTLTTTRAILAAARGQTLEQTDSTVTTAMLEDILDRIAAMPLAERRRVPGLPERRADVMPTALATVLALAEFGGFREFQHSLYNLRWGLAAELLADLS